MNQLALITLLGWPLLALATFMVLPVRRAVLVTFLFAWLFLPMAGIRVPGFIDYNKVVATVVGTGLGILLFDTARVLSYRFSMVDLPMVAWCAAPMASSLDNGLGPYDGLSGVIVQLFSWGLPYLIGRLYLSDPVGLREAAIAILVAGLIYMPLCLFEIRMSPQLHKALYGYHPAPFRTQRRFGGFRPMVFMDSGLATSLWMCTSSVVGAWLWRTGSVRTILHVPLSWLVPPLVVTTVLCKSMGAVALMVVGIGTLLATRRLRGGVIVAALVIMPIVYVGVRASGLWSGQHLVDLAARVDTDRAASLQFRFDNENILAEHALRQPLFGWGGWSRNRVVDEKGRDMSVTDGLWIIAFGKNGLLAVAALLAMTAVPVWLFLRRVPAPSWHLPNVAPAAALGMVVLLFALDNLLNAMLNPVFALVIGGVSGLVIALGQRSRTVARQPGASPPAATLHRSIGSSRGLHA